MTSGALEHLGVGNFDHTLAATALTLGRPGTGIQTESLSRQFGRIGNTKLRKFTERSWVELHGFIHKHVNAFRQHASCKGQTADLLAAHLRQINGKNCHLVKHITRVRCEVLIVIDVLRLIGTEVLSIVKSQGGRAVVINRVLLLGLTLL